ncbi:MAG: hypothetical protein ACE363_06390 [Alphaproteobacteria bacterium]
MDNPIIRSFAFALAVATLVISNPALAETEDAAETIVTTQDIKEGTQFRDYLESMPHRQARAAVAAQEDLAANRFCEEGYTMVPVAVKILAPVESVAGTAGPVSGRWMERVSGERCGETFVYNFLFEADGTRIEALPVALGTTGLDPDLIRDLRPVVVPLASIEGCSQKALIDTAQGLPEGFAPEEPDSRYETWTVSGCGALVDMILRIGRFDDGRIKVDIESQQPG